MKKGLNLEISSDLDYEGMVINIVYNPEEIDFNSKKKIYKQNLIATLNQDKGVDKIEIKLFPIQENFLNFSFDEFLQILQKAKELLIKCNK